MDSLRNRLDNTTATILLLLLLTGVVTVAFVGAGVLQTSSEPDHGRDGNSPGMAHAGIDGGSANVTANATVDYVNLSVSYETTTVNFSSLTITWLGPHGRESLIYQSQSETNVTSTTSTKRFTIVPVRDVDNSEPKLTAGDEFKLIMDATSIQGRPLTSNQTVELRLMTQEGVVKVYRITLPSSLDEAGATDI